MTRTRWIFVAIVVAALAIAGIGIFLSQRGGAAPGAALTVDKPEAVKVRVLTSLPIEPWVRSAAADFNAGDYAKAVQQQIDSEVISKVLYPNDQTPQGKELRLRQQYFFVACSIQDVFRYIPSGFDLRQLPKRFVFQLNDTHPTVAVAEMMRVLMDERHVPWIVAWEITSKMFGYTSHTLLPEALETWPIDIFGRLLPRHLEIIYEINHRFLAHVRARFPGDEARELDEEAGILIDGRPELFSIYGNGQLFPGDHIALFVVRSWRQPRIPKPNAEIAEQGFFARDQLPSALNPPTFRRINEILDASAPAEMW